MKLKTIHYAIIAILLVATLGVGTGVIPFSMFESTGISQSIDSVTPVNQSGTEVTVVSNDQELSQIKFIIPLTVGIGGKESLTATDIKNELSGATTTSVMKFRTTNVDDELLYSVVNTNPSAVTNSIYTYRMVTGTGTLSDICPSGTRWFIKNPNSFLGQGKYCVFEDKIGVKANLGSPVYKASVTTEFLINNSVIGKSVVTSLNGYKDQFGVTGSTQADIRKTNGEFVGSVIWNGALPNIVESGITVDRVAVTNTPNCFTSETAMCNWSLADGPLFSDYRSARDILVTQLNNLQANGFASNTIFDFPFTPRISIPECFGIDCANKLNSIFTTFNTAVATPLTTQKKVFVYPNVNSFTEYKPEGFSFNLQQELIRHPRLKFSLNATSIGIILSVGKPLIIDLNPKTLKFDSGTTVAQSVSVVVQNTGTADAIFRGKVIGCNLAVVNNPEVSVLVGETRTMQINVLGTQVSTGTCTVEVYDSLKSANLSRMAFNYEITQIRQCTPNEKRIDGIYVKKCRADGSAEDIILTCNDGVQFANGAYTCIVPPPPGTHLACVNNMCTQVPGFGSTECGPVNSSCGIPPPPSCLPPKIVVNGVCTDQNLTCGLLEKKVTSGTTCVDFLDNSKNIGKWWGFCAGKEIPVTTPFCETDWGLVIILIVVVIGAIGLGGLAVFGIALVTVFKAIFGGKGKRR